MKSILLLVVILAIACFGCMVGKGVVHTVRDGETLWRIANAYGADPQELAEVNNLGDPAELKPGTKIFIPGATGRRSVNPRPKPAEGAAHKQDKKKRAPQAATSDEREDRVVVQKDRFIWPVKGTIAMGFGVDKDGVRHDGIDIKAVEGALIKAADDGHAVFASDMKSYGNTVILKHGDNFYTVYAHNKSNMVKNGDKVKKGATIATVGATGAARFSQLHFEVRQGKKVRNPLFFLP
ncbi:MAG: peptidoglycan DD-metalloendopeptidase family protein [Deltaproteobacteria bacterium]|nr:peptidoglycan DD-metalloendopeptidase family protein [Deltaproteobacteria bacterium]